MEFSAYGRYSQLVETMVNCDLPVIAVDYFYTSENHNLIKYRPTIDEAMDYLQDYEGIVATTIEFKTREMLLEEQQTGIVESHTHAICVVRKDPYYYLFDPNGPVVTGQSTDYYKYIYLGQPCTSQQFINRLKSTYGIPKFIYEKANPGIQSFAPDEMITPYIEGGSYCMFYLYWFINHIAQPANWNHTQIKKMIQYRYSETDSGDFLAHAMVPEASRIVIEDVMDFIFDVLDPAECPHPVHN
jgi:hypothetical protein